MENRTLEHEIVEILAAAHQSTDVTDAPVADPTDAVLVMVTEAMIRYTSALETVVLRLAREIDTLRNA